MGVPAWIGGFRVALQTGLPSTSGNENEEEEDGNMGNHSVCDDRTEYRCGGSSQVELPRGKGAAQRLVFVCAVVHRMF